MRFTALAMLPTAILSAPAAASSQLIERPALVDIRSARSAKRCPDDGAIERLIRMLPKDSRKEFRLDSPEHQFASVIVSGPPRR